MVASFLSYHEFQSYHDNLYIYHTMFKMTLKLLYFYVYIFLALRFSKRYQDTIYKDELTTCLNSLMIIYT